MVDEAELPGDSFALDISAVAGTALGWGSRLGADGSRVERISGDDPTNRSLFGNIAETLELPLRIHCCKVLLCRQMRESAEHGGRRDTKPSRRRIFELGGLCAVIVALSAISEPIRATAEGGGDGCNPGRPSIVSKGQDGEMRSVFTGHPAGVKAVEKNYCPWVGSKLPTCVCFCMGRLV